MNLSELPWDEPTFNCREYIMWKDKEYKLLNSSPWVKIDTLALSLLRKVSFILSVIKNGYFEIF